MADQQIEQPQKSDGKGGVKSVLAGGFGGICVVLSGHPFDTVKVRLQTMPLPGPGQSPMYTGALDCVKKTISREGTRGLYKGMAAPLAGTAPIFALSFFGFDLGKKTLEGWQTDKNQPLGVLGLAAAGGFSGVLTTTIMAPGERVKCLLQVQQGSSGSAVKYAGPWDCAKSLYREGGMRNIYKGTAATLARDVPASAMYFGSYEVIQRALVPEGGDRSDLGIWRSLLAGGLAGMANWAVALPPDVLKSRLQSAPAGQYNGMRDVFTHLMKTEGPKGLFKGAGPVFTRAFVANACCFTGYEFAMWVMNKYLPDV